MAAYSHWQASEKPTRLMEESRNIDRCLGIGIFFKKNSVHFEYIARI